MIIPVVHLAGAGRAVGAWQQRMGDIWLVTGIPGAGKSTVARLLAGRLERSAHIEGDRLHELIVSGRILPGQEPADEERRQILLSVRNQCLLARSFSEAGFVPIIDYVITRQALLEEYRGHLTGCDLHLIVLAPAAAVALRRDRARPEKTVAEPWLHLDEVLRRELHDVGLWIDSSHLTPDQTAVLALRGKVRARISP